MNDVLPERFSTILRRIAGFGTLFFLLLWLGHYYYMKKAFEREGRYTVCVMKERFPRTSGGYALKYSYFVNGEQYTDDVYLNVRNDFAKLQHHYLVEFVESNPKLHRVLFKLPITKGSDIPPEGWKEMPVEILDQNDRVIE
jgi:hypothetical protein